MRGGGRECVSNGTHFPIDGNLTLVVIFIPKRILLFPLLILMFFMTFIVSSIHT